MAFVTASLVVDIAVTLKEVKDRRCSAIAVATPGTSLRPSDSSRSRGYAPSLQVPSSQFRDSLRSIAVTP